MTTVNVNAVFELAFIFFVTSSLSIIGGGHNTGIVKEHPFICCIHGGGKDGGGMSTNPLTNLNCQSPAVWWLTPVPAQKYMAMC